jgi:hypothetical protein
VGANGGAASEVVERAEVRVTDKLRAYYCALGNEHAVVLVPQDAERRRTIARETFLGYLDIEFSDEVKVLPMGRASGKELERCLLTTIVAIRAEKIGPPSTR